MCGFALDWTSTLALERVVLLATACPIDEGERSEFGCCDVNFALSLISLGVDYVVYNPLSGRAHRVDPDAVGKRYLKGEYQVVAPWELERFIPSNKVLVVGGDGTLSTVLQWAYRYPVEILYLPMGTLNERGKQGASPYLGLAGERAFGYVLATGVFCPLGWVASERDKKRWGRLAYLAKVWGEYKVPSIPAQVVSGGKTYCGQYALIMLIHSSTCFGLRFNRAYDREHGGGHLLLLPSTGRDGLLARIKLFFPLFRVFFVGVKADRETSRYIWRKVDEVTVDAPKLDWCLDGERVSLSRFAAAWVKMRAKVTVLSPREIKRTIDKLPVK